MQQTQERILRKQGARGRELLQLHGCFHAEVKPYRIRREKRLLSLLTSGRDRGQTAGGYLVRGWWGRKNRKGKKLINNPKCRGQVQQYTQRQGWNSVLPLGDHFISWHWRQWDSSTSCPLRPEGGREPTFGLPLKGPQAEWPLTVALLCAQRD